MVWRGEGEAETEAEVEAEVEAEGEAEAAALAPARRLLRAAAPLADAASAAALRVPLPLLQIKGPKPSRARKSVAMHVAIPEGLVKLKPRDASVSAEGTRWLLHAAHGPCAHHAHTMRTPCAHHAHTMHTLLPGCCCIRSASRSWPCLWRA